MDSSFRNNGFSSAGKLLDSISRTMMSHFSGTMGRVWLHCGGVTTEARENDRDLFTFTDGARKWPESLKMDLSTKIGDT